MFTEFKDTIHFLAPGIFSICLLFLIWVAFFMACREIVLWYFKINRLIDRVTDVNDSLKKIGLLLADQQRILINQINHSKESQS